MFKLYQVVNGKARLCGYDANNKRSLVAKAISLPSGVSRRSPTEINLKPVACVAGWQYF